MFQKESVQLSITAVLGTVALYGLYIIGVLALSVLEGIL